MVEQDEKACDTLRLNEDEFNDHTNPTIIQKNIREVETREILEAANVGVGGITAVYGGPPCQGFSTSNPNRSVDDDRNELYREMVRVVNEAKPAVFVMENVPGLASMADGEVIKQICEDFQQCGYHVRWDILNAADYGVPQKRKRTFIIGKRIDVMMMPAVGNPQFHMAAKSGEICHPEFFREKHGLEDRGQTGIDMFTDEPETLDELVEQAVQGDIQ